jgi:hypothetical protein
VRRYCPENEKINSTTILPLNVFLLFLPGLSFENHYGRDPGRKNLSQSTIKVDDAVTHLTECIKIKIHAIVIMTIY